MRISTAHVSTQEPAPRFKIIDESDEYIVVDKPAFLLMHPTKPDQRTTLLVAADLMSGIVDESA